ncbi:MAG: MFS transporter [Phycisphaerales bacterium]|nr:MFS transporter [Phycisphaerales bacterium]
MISTALESRIAAAPQRSGARLVMFVAFLGFFLSGYNNFMLPLELIKLTPTFNLSAGQNGELLAATFLGMLLGGAIFGRLADLLGRKPAMIVNMLIIAACAIAAGFVTGPDQLLTLRLILGIGIGGGYPIGSAYVADIAQNHHRGSKMTLAFSGWGFGALAAGLFGWAMLALLPANQGWRWMLASGAIPAIIAMAVIAFMKMPESHAWKHARTLEPLSARALFSPAHCRLTIAKLLDCLRVKTFHPTKPRYLTADPGLCDIHAKPKTRITSPATIPPPAAPVMVAASNWCINMG